MSSVRWESMRWNPSRTPSTIPPKLSTERFASSFPLMLLQTLSTGFKSGAYGGRRTAVSHLCCSCRYAFVLRLRWEVSPSHTRIIFFRRNARRSWGRNSISFASLKLSDTMRKNKRETLPSQRYPITEQMDSFFQLNG